MRVTEEPVPDVPEDDGLRVGPIIVYNQPEAHEQAARSYESTGTTATTSWRRTRTWMTT